MKKRVRITCIYLIAAILISPLFGCQRRGSIKQQEAPTTLKIYLFGQIENMAHVIEEFEKRTADTLNIKLDITCLPADEYRQRIPLMLASARDMDLVFDAFWMNMGTEIAEDRYLDLEDYFNNEKFQGFYNSFPEKFLTANRYNGKLYGIPLGTLYNDANGIIYRKDVLKGCDLDFDSITNLEQLQQFYEAILQKAELQMEPLSLGSRGFYLIFSNEITLTKNSIFDVPGMTWPNFPIKIALSQDGENVKDVLVLGDSKERYINLPDELNYDFFSERFLRHADWAKYIQKNSMLEQNAATRFAMGMSASTEIGVANIKYIQDELLELHPNAEVDFFPYYEQYNGDLTNLKLPLKPSSNYICIPKTSGRIDKAMEFLNWIFLNQENNDLFTLGVKNVDWMDEGNNQYSVIENNTTKYTFPFYELSANPNFIKIPKGTAQPQQRLIEFSNNIDNFEPYPLQGFVFDSSKVSTEYSQLIDLFKEYYKQLQNGQYGAETQRMIDEFYTRAQSLNLEAVRSEIILQAQAFLDEH